LRKSAAWLAGTTFWKWGVAAAEAYPDTVAALGDAFQRETDAHRRYLAFAGVAMREGYKGIAYLFTAFAMSEGVHARNFRDLVARLGGQAIAAPTATNPGTTKQSVIAAVEDEIDTIDNLYPRTLERIRRERHVEARRLVKFAWESERQHREQLLKIRRYSPVLFEKVAKTIDEKTRLYFVCQACGSTLGQVPSPNCPVCADAPAQYLQVPIPS
jgi:rubrerythrin